MCPPDEGVTGVPSAAAGVTGVPAAVAPGDVGGVQGATSGTPPAGEGKTPAYPTQSPPSGFGDPAKGPPQEIPYGRFQEINQQLQEERRKNADLESRLAGPPVPAAPTPGSPVPTPDNGHLGEVQRNLVAAQEAGDAVGQANAIAQLISLNSQQAMTDVMGKFIAKQQEAQQAAEYNRTRGDSLMKLRTEFPQLADHNSEFTKLVWAEHASDVWLQNSPTGEYQAALQVANRLRMGSAPTGGAPEANALRQQQLGQPGVPFTAPSDIQNQRGDWKKAIEGLEGGSDADLHQYLTDHVVGSGR